MLTLPARDLLEAEYERRERARAAALGREHDDQLVSALWTPLPGPQTQAYESLGDEMFYGGAPGGGKTDLALGLALTKHQSSIIFRRESTQMRGPEGMIERSKDIIGAHGRLNENMLTWRGLPGGRSLEFGSVQREDDKNKYKGRAHDLKVFDELPDFSESQFRFLCIWLRTTITTQRTRVIGTGNPPTTPEGQWVVRYWAPWLDQQHPNPAKPGELRWFAVIDGKDVEVSGPQAIKHQGEVIRPRSRTFIPARVEDNPFYMATGYADVLNNLPEPLRSQMRFGNFNATQKDHPWQLIPTAWVKLAQKRWRDRRPPTTPLTAIGVDPSRGGVDQFAIAKRHDNWFAPIIKHEGIDARNGIVGARLVWDAVDGDTTIPIGIDVGGAAGSSVYDQSTVMGLKAYAMNGSEASTARDKSGKLGFVNKRAEWHWRLREALDPSSGQDVALPADPQLTGDLCAPRWKLTVRGIQVEDKREIIKRIGRSPDCGESVIYAASEDVVLTLDPADVLSRGEQYDTARERKRGRF